MIRAGGALNARQVLSLFRYDFFYLALSGSTEGGSGEPGVLACSVSEVLVLQSPHQESLQGVRDTSQASGLETSLSVIISTFMYPSPPPSHLKPSNLSVHLNCKSSAIKSLKL